MTECAEGRHTAFVIMPFADEFTSTYQELIEPALNESGFSVSRADELHNQRFLLRDIVQSITEADLIVADLSLDNPNVYYELGVAHALRKPVIMVTRDVTRLPFDLQSYRVIPYSMQLGEALRAHKALQLAATGLLTGETRFSNPVSDSLGFDITSPNLSSTSGEVPLGILDYVEELERHTTAMTTSMTHISERTVEYTASLQRSTSEFEDLAKRAKTRPTPQQIRTLLSATTTTFDDYGNFLATENNTYQAILEPLEASLEGLITLHEPSTDEQRQEFSESLDSLRRLRSIAGGAQQALVKMSTEVDSLPPLEQRFNRSQKKVSRELNSLVGNIERTAAIVGRAITLGEAKLSD